jgi:hypothetical protein
LISDFTQNDTSPDRNYTLRIPSYGIATTPLTVTSTGDAPIGPYTLFVFANSSFPPEQFIESRSPQESARSGLLPASALTSENIFTQYSLLVTVREPLTLVDQVGDLWDKVGQPISFITGIIIGYVGPWIYTKIKERSKNQRS